MAVEGAGGREREKKYFARESTRRVERESPRARLVTYLYPPTRLPTYPPTYLHTYLHTYLLTHIHTPIHTCIGMPHTYMHTQTPQISPCTFVRKPGNERKQH